MGLIEENSEELELAMQAASRQPLQQIATNVCTPPAGAPEAAAEQGCPKRLLVGGREASPFWGGSKNPDGSKKKIARYNTKEEKTSRQKQNGKLRTQRKDEVRKRFFQRRIEAETNGQWSGPRKFEEWLLGVAERVLDGDSIEDTAQVAKYELNAIRSVARALWLAGATKEMKETAFKELDEQFKCT